MLATLLSLAKTYLAKCYSLITLYRSQEYSSTKYLRISESQKSIKRNLMSNVYGQ